MVGVGFVVLAVVAAVGVRAWWADRSGYPKGWEEQAIGDLGISPDRTAVMAQPYDYLSDSCYELRAEVSPGDDRWVVTLEARRTDAFCTLEGCIDDPRRTEVARTLDLPGEMPCGATVVELDEPVPEGVDVVPA